MKKSKSNTFIVSIVLLATAISLQAKVQLSGVFTDHMVLQRNAQVPVWGWADPGEVVTVKFAGQEKMATTDTGGKWMVKLDELAASTDPREFCVSGKLPEEKIIISDVVVGDVWLCSGQSNMEFTMGRLKDTIYANDLKTANFPLMRQGMVPRHPALKPQEDAAVKWTVCTPESVDDFTAVGFYFAREVSKELGVPIGLLHSSWGGTMVESWTSLSALDTVPDFKARADKQIVNLETLPEQIKLFPAAISVWQISNGRVDTENAGEEKSWQKMNANASDWRKSKINAMWFDSGLTNGGIAWVRKEVDLPASVVGKSLRFDLGFVDEEYVTAYWNGEKLGEFGKNAPHFYHDYVHFDVQPGLLKPGENVFALRFVVDTPDKSPVNLHALDMGFLDMGMSNLSDDCLIKVEREFSPLTKSELFARPATPEGDEARTSGALFGGMIQPLIPFAIKGVVWYQGEQDAGQAFSYRKRLPLMICDWRKRWDWNVPFIIQQLPNWNDGGANRTEWAELREAQALTAASLSNCCLSVSIDIGEANNVHPKNKHEAGRRLALVALAKVYGQPLDYCGPVYESMSVQGLTIRLKFKFANGLKSLDGQPLRNFTIAGNDQRFVAADAKIDGETVVVSSPQVAAPVAVRYAFINNPIDCNLSNVSGLPAMPFRTDIGQRAQ
jgi:sialate O-acetylesterase